MDKTTIINNFYTNLDIIAKIEDGHKLFIDKHNMIQLDEPFMFQGIWRYCYSISRKDALHVLTKLFNDIEIYINALYLKNTDNKNTITNMNIMTANTSINGKLSRISSNDLEIFISTIEKINKALSGISKLKLTYKDDELTCNELDKIIAKGKSLVDTFTVMM